MLKPAFKKLINGLLATAGYKVIRLPRSNISGQYLFEDIKMVLETDSPVCLDVGANRGQTIDCMLEAFGSPVIHAFEPSADTFSKLLKKNYPKSVHLHQCAMGSVSGRQAFFNYGDSQLSSFLRLDQATANPFRLVQENGTEQVDIETVDRFVSQQSMPELDLLKIDTQGFDFEVLKGSSATLAAGKIKCVLVEINFIPLYEQQADAAQIFAYLADRQLFLVDLYEKVIQGPRLGWCTALFVRDSTATSAAAEIRHR
jgi:FkbM family methyltransferase